MAKRLIQLARELKIGISPLMDMLGSLGYNEASYAPNTIIPDYMVEMVNGICNEGDLLKLIQPTPPTPSISQQDNKCKFKVLGKIDIGDTLYQQSINDHTTNPNCYYSYGDMPHYSIEQTNFWIEEIFILVSGKICSIKVRDIDRCKQDHPLYSVLIGPNGVGKSSILRDIVNFFIELNAQVTNNSRNPASYKGLLRGIRYNIDGQEYFVVKANKSFVATINGRVRKLEYVQRPSIVACHFGAFDKFPNQAVDGYSTTKYDIPHYKYVGAHINGNMISSSGIAFRLLFTLNENMDVKLRRNICSILDFIGYDHTISLQYSLVLKSRKNGSVHDFIAQGVEKDREYQNCSTREKQAFATQLYGFYKDKVALEKSQCVYRIDFDNEYASDSERLILKNIYKLKQYSLLNSVRIWFYKGEQIISSDDMSSGEFAMLATILSISAAANNHHTLVLLDEPELSQHPNWQMSLIHNLDTALSNQVCHLLIATHSHMVVSDLPQGRSSVVQLDKMKDGSLEAQLIGCSTYGWSAEEVLLKVFRTATDRNRYFGERIAKLLEKMGNNTIGPQEVVMELHELQEISKYLSDIDPMKSVLNTIINAYSK